ncbi:hypothetical protein WA026_007085 [Henosepilachna vigintioctopunctata]|uniref:F-box domain-containing protein n=1 Tax=Henosepilachna vigintioctopunctata TaxID=420089 RepID=A0AAW1VAD9_9CUCU
MTSEGILVSSNEQKNLPSDQEISDILAILDDLVLNESHNKNMHLEKLDKVLQKCGPSGIFKFVQKCSNPEVKPLVLRRLGALATMSVKEGSINAIDMFNVEEGLNEKHVVDILSDAFGNLPTDILNKILCDIIIPEMFNNNNFSKKIHDIIIDVGFRLIKKFPITNLSNQEIKLFTTKVIEKYSKILETLREQNYNRWHDLWIFFVRFLAKHLHVSMDLANKLLRVVEFAFRNPSYEQRLKGYDCWKELIDNASLDMNHLCSNKQIKLLITPLRAKFSKMEIVICKRFEVFLYLLEKLQRQSVLCLNEFLEFCFGVSNNTNNCSKNGQGKLVPNLWLKSIQVFLAILGDQTYISATLNRTLFEEPVIDAHNINKFGYVTVCAVIECSIILKQISIEPQEKISILTSLWEALFDIIVKTSTETQEKCFQTIFDSLSTIFKVYNEDVAYVGLYAAFSHLLESSIDQRLISDSLKLLLEYSLKFLGDVDVSDEFSQQLCELIKFVSKEIHMIDFLLQQFKKLETSRNESKLFTVWNILGTKLMADFNITSHLNMIIHFFLWPVHHLQNLGPQTSVDTCSSWLRLFVKASQVSETIKTVVLDEYEKCMKSNPLLSDNVATLISVLAHSKMDFTREFVDKILKLVFTIMSLPLLPQETSEKMYDLVLKCTNAVATFADDVNSEMVNTLRQCIEKIRSHQRNPQLVEVLENILNKKILRQSPAIHEKKRRLSIAKVGLQDSSSGTPTGNIKRSLRMTQMAFEKESEKPDNRDKVNALKFFGKDVETMTPLKVKGSVLQNLKNTTPNSRSKKIINSVKKSLVPEPPFIEDHTSDYVLINSEVKLQKDKLTEHQIEEMKRRREDIPALYQDLSQSQTQSLSSNSKDVVTIPSVAEVEMSEKDEEHLDTEVSAINFGCHVKNSDGTNSSTEENSATSIEIEEIFLDSGITGSVNKKKSQTNIAKELRKIQMNIVGGDTFLDNLPSKRTRKVITPIPTKKQKKSEEESKMNEENNEEETDTHVSNNERTKTKRKKSDACEESRAQVPKIDTILKKEQFTNIEKPLADRLEKEVEEHTDSSPHSNNRKNKFIKPKKLIVTPKSEKKRTNSDVTGTSKKKIIPAKMKTTKLEFEEAIDSIEESSTKKSISDEIQSEIMFASETYMEKGKKTDKVKHVKATNKSEENCFAPVKARQTDSVKETGSISHKQVNQSDAQKNNIEKYKKRPKEIMKKNKEKVRKIQSQLKLASLSDLTDSSEPKKTKGEKLLFIREITKSKHVENTKLAPAGLKRNKDKKSSSIAYSIEPPNTSFDLTSLNLGIVQTSPKKSTRAEEVLSDTEMKKPTKKRKRAYSLNSISTSSSANACSSIEKEQKVHKKVKLTRKSIEEMDVTIIEKSNPEDSTEGQEMELDIKKSSPLKIKTAFVTNPKSDVVESKKISPTKKNSPLKKTPVGKSLENQVRITRSKASSLSPMDQANLNSSKPKNNVNDEPSKVVMKLLFPESEDIIESSQDSLLETTAGNLSKSRNKLSPKTRSIPLKMDSEEDVICEDEERRVLAEHSKSVHSTEVEMLSNGEGSASFREKTKSAISQADTLTCDSNVEPQPIVIDLDLPEKPELTESGQILSTADTVSIVSQNSEEGEIEIVSISVLDVNGKDKTLSHAEKSNTVQKTPKQNEEATTEDLDIGTPRTQRSRDLPGSPVSNVTPTLTRELFDNTMDISPISSQLSLEEEKCQENEIEKKLDDVLGQTVGGRVESRVSNDCKSDDKAQMSLNLRSDRLLNMINVASPVSHKKITKKAVTSPAPVNSRYEKLFSFFNENKEDEGRANKKKEDLVATTENIEDVLTFSREVPSPYALPSSGILKRKLTDLEEGLSPCAKRKRVNFSYPCISSTKLYIRHKEEMNTYCPPLLAQRLFGDDYEDEDSADEDPFANPNVETVETEESMSITNSLMLCRKKPIYEQLVNCTENIDRLWKRLSSPTYSELLKKLLSSKKIYTIGDLASLSEVQINRLPFKQPRIKTVRKALNFYFTNVYKKIIDASEPCTSADSQNDNPTDGRVDEAPENIPEETIETNGKLTSEDDLREEFVNVLTKIKIQKISLEEFGAIFLDVVEENEVIDVLKSVYNTDFRKFFEKCHWRYLMETIVQSGGTTEMFDIISDLAKSNEAFASKLESVIQMRISERPLKDLISQRPLTELKGAIEECINREVFKREEVAQMCLVPLIKSPSDIKSYFNNLTIVQIHELFIERVQSSDLTLFLEQIKEHYGNYTVAQCANRSDVLKLCSKEELMTSLVDKKHEVESVIELIGKITDQNKLLTLYDFIGSRISKESRREKFIEFLSSIPLSSNSDESRLH